MKNVSLLTIALRVGSSASNLEFDGEFRATENLGNLVICFQLSKITLRNFCKLDCVAPAVAEYARVPCAIE
jgi:hypothetical protein